MVRKPPQDHDEGHPQEPDHPEHPFQIPDQGQAPQEPMIPIIDFEPVYRAPPPEDSESSESEEDSEVDSEEDEMPELMAPEDLHHDPFFVDENGEIWFSRFQSNSFQPMSFIFFWQILYLLFLVYIPDLFAE